MFSWKYEFFLNNVSVSIYYDKTVYHGLYIASMWKRTKKYITNWAEDCIRSTWKQFSKWIIKAHWWAFMWMKESERKDLAATMGPKTFWSRYSFWNYEVDFWMFFPVTSKFKNFLFVYFYWRFSSKQSDCFKNSWKSQDFQFWNCLLDLEYWTAIKVADIRLNTQIHN